MDESILSQWKCFVASDEKILPQISAYWSQSNVFCGLIFKGDAKKHLSTYDNETQTHTHDDDDDEEAEKKNE